MSAKTVKTKGRENKMAPVYTLQYAVKKKNLKLFHELIQKSDIDLNKRDKFGFTPLIYASSRGSKEMVQTLIEKGADLNKGNLNGDGPLMWAILSNYQSIAKMLIEFGANPDQQNISGETPLMAAAYQGEGALVHLMIEKGANALLVDRKKQTAANKAEKRGYFLIADYLRKAELKQKQKITKKKISLPKTFFKGEKQK